MIALVISLVVLLFLPKAVYKTGLRIDPNHPILNFNIAEVFRIQDKYAEAMLSYQTALKARPNWTSALTGMADCHIKMGELQKAIEIYKNITENETKEGRSVNRRVEITVLE